MSKYITVDICHKLSIAGGIRWMICWL